MNRFRSCVNRSACTEDGTSCRSCGRSHDEINGIRSLTSEVSNFLDTMNYDNPEEFLEYLQSKVMKKIKYKTN